MSDVNIGDTLGQWTVLELLPRKGGHPMVRARCQCGRVLDRNLTHMLSGLSTRCKQCFFAANQKSKTPEYEAWLALIQRCTNPNNPRWKDYGGRGIRVCDAWRASFDAFLADVGTRPGHGYSIDRRENDGNYEPGNCRWATRSEQQLNQRRQRQAVHA